MPKHNSTQQEKESKERSYERISPTAWGVAHRRTFTDIPFSKEIFDEFEAILKQDGRLSEAKDYMIKERTEISPFFEARYLLLNELVKREGSKQIIELASGLTPRGLEFTENDDDISYVEMDLPEILTEKEEIIRKIIKNKRLEAPKNLYFEAGNALKVNELDRATSHFDTSKEITVIHEGLLRYLSHDEKKQLA